MGVSRASAPQESRERDVSDAVVEKVAAAEGVAPTELDTRLYDVVEPEALNDLFQRDEDGPTTEGVVSFRFHGYEVSVHSDSSVDVDGRD